MERIFHDLDIIDPPSQRAEQVEALLKRFAKTWKMNATDAKAILAKVAAPVAKKRRKVGPADVHAGEDMDDLLKQVLLEGRATDAEASSGESDDKGLEQDVEDILLEGGCDDADPPGPAPPVPAPPLPVQDPDVTARPGPASGSKDVPFQAGPVGGAVLAGRPLMYEANRGAKPQTHTPPTHQRV